MNHEDKCNNQAIAREKMFEKRSLDWHLRENDFFNGLSVEKESFMSLSKRREFKKNSMVFFEEDMGQSCFYVESGIIKIFKVTLEGKEPIVFLRRQGEFFGLAEVVVAESRKANAQAITHSILWEISRTDMETLFADFPNFSKRVIQILGRRIRYLGQQIENLVACDVTTRLAKLLVYLSFDALTDPESWENPVTVPVNLTQEQMASMTGSCQQTISDTLKSFQENGLIKISKKQIIIFNPLKLLSNAEY